MNNEDARKIAEARLAEKGYVHPENSNYSTNNPQYMAYNDSKETDVYVTQNNDVYASYNTEEDETKTTNKPSKKSFTPKYCPVCERQATFSCSCPLLDVMCDKGHIWYSLSTGKIIVGDPHADEE